MHPRAAAVDGGHRTGAGTGGADARKRIAAGRAQSGGAYRPVRHGVSGWLRPADAPLFRRSLRTHDAGGHRAGSPAGRQRGV
ncbi:hypothetical protein SDC9_206768 [bioreactor metagenome]|uniref:Uncharacterized protein n=1 Tax=bioreactor metagenome TaxID=1076179 RepID=A0A645J7E0_9ZZZZ